MLPILEAVVERGTARQAQVPGYTVAGKTGTADKLVNGRYVGHMQNVSFLGFVPSRNPALTVIVMIDTPRVGSDTGGAVAAPIFRRIAEASLRYLGVPPNINPAAAVMVARREQSHLTRTSAAAPPPSIVTLATGGGSVSLIPDLRGLSARDALRTLASLGLSARVQGTGVVVEQTPLPGSPLERGISCHLVLDRDTSRLIGAGAQP
jgi:cell division protein FtsI (penicillin-binding protein 3)